MSFLFGLLIKYYAVMCIFNILYKLIKNDFIKSYLSLNWLYFKNTNFDISY